MAGIALSAPTAVATAGNATSIGPNSVGGSPLAAPADHRHDFGAALQRKRVAVPPSGVVQWIFDTRFVDGSGADIIPSMGCLIESPSGGPVFSEPQITSVDASQVTLQIKAQATNITIALGGLVLFGGTIPANTFLHLSARNPSV